MEYSSPLKLPSPLISTAKSLIVCCCHDKRFRVFRLLCDRFPQYLSLFCFFVLFRQNGRLFVFLRNIHSSIEILKIKILEYSYPPSQYFFVNNAFIRFFFVSPEGCAVPIWQNGTVFKHVNHNVAGGRRVEWQADKLVPNATKGIKIKDNIHNDFRVSLIQF